MIRLMIVIAVGFSGGTASRVAPRPVSGPASVVAGDALVVERQRFELAGIDAPEPLQYCLDETARPYHCGATSLRALHQLTSGLVVTCRPQSAVSPPSPRAHCFVGGKDIAAERVKRGLAVATGAVPGYVAAQAEARAGRRGLWAGSFVPPDRWRESFGRTPPITSTTKVEKR
jgi:endonuclease YncB( thermonuclease family)